MAEKINLFELDINVDKVYEDIAKTKSNIATLAAQYKGLKASTGDFTVEIGKVKAELQAENKELKSQENLAKNLVIANKGNTNSIEALRAKLIATTIEWTKYTDAEIEEGGRAGQLNTQKKELTETIKKLEKATGDHRREVGNYGLSVQGIKKELRELKAVMLQNADGTKEYNDALKRAAFLTDEMADMQLRVKGTAMDFDGVMSNVVKTTSGIASAFEAGQGAMALFGNESEDVQKAMLKVQAAIALANGLQGLDGMGKAFTNLLTQVKTFASGMNKALLATGIGAFVVTIGIAIAKWDEIKEAVSGVTNEQRKAGELAKINLKVEQDKLSALENQDNILKLQGKTERDILKLKIAQTDEVIAASEAEIENINTIGSAQIKAEERNRKILEGLLKFTLLPLRAIDGFLTSLAGKLNELGKVFGKDWKLDFSTNIDKIDQAIANQIFDPDKMAQDLKAQVETLQQGIQKLKNERAGYQLSIIELDKKGNDAAEKEAQQALKTKEKLNDAMLKSNENFLKASEKQREIEKQQALASVAELELQLEIFKTTEAEKIKTVQDRAVKQAEIETSIAAEKYNLGLINEQEFQNQLAQIQKNSFDTQISANKDALALEQAAKYENAKNNIFEQLELDRQGLEEKRQQEIAYAESIQADTTAIEQKYSDARKEINEIEQNTKLSLAADFAGNIAKIAGEGTAIGKAAAVAQTTISTYQAATGAYSALAGIPVVGPVLGVAAAAAAVVAGLANVKKILAVKLPGTSGSGSGSGVSGSTSQPVTSIAPQANIAPTVGAGIISRDQVLSQQKQMVLQPTLVIDNVTNNQNKNLANSNTSIL